MMNRTQHEVTLTPHASRRSQQRAIRPEVVDQVLEWGRVILQPQGRTAYFLGRRDVARLKRQGVDVSAAESVAVVTRDNAVLTVIRTTDLTRLRTYQADQGRQRRAA